MVDPAPATAEDAYREASELRQRREFASALELYKAVCAWTFGRPPKKMLRKAYTGAMKCSSRLMLWPETEEVARGAIKAFPDFPLAYCHLGEALMNLGRPGQAQKMLSRALELDPEQDVARGLLRLLSADTGRLNPNRTLRIWPIHGVDFEDPKRLVRKFLLRGAPKAPFIDEHSVFMTLGSCFAGNLGRRLEAAGHQVHYEDIGEEINSTYANRYLFDWIEHGPINPPTQAMQEAYGAAGRDRLRRALAASNVMVLTLGVAPSFFNEQTGDFAFLTTGSITGLEHLRDRHVMRTTTVAENVENVRHILDSVRRLAQPGARTVLTVSPVPLSGTTEFDSAVIADCLSKSTLRLACHEVVTSEAAQGVVYWPSFEIVRWLGTHFGPSQPPVFGVEDGNMRHVSSWLIDVIIDMFLEHWSVADAHA